MKKTASNRRQLGDKSLHAVPLQSSRACLWATRAVLAHREQAASLHPLAPLHVGGARVVKRRNGSWRWPWVKADRTCSYGLAGRISALTYRVLPLTLQVGNLTSAARVFLSRNCSPGWHQPQVLQSNCKRQLIIDRVRLAQVGSRASVG